MNKHTKELVGKALDKAVPYTWDSLDYHEMEKLLETFAELIVRECFDVVINDGRFHDAKGIIRAGKGVAMEHFGVEE